MRKSNAIDVYFHMKNHYKKLKQVKSVTDCACPKGRSKGPKSNPVRSNSSQRNDSLKLTRPQTRRSNKDTPSKLQHVERPYTSSRIKEPMHVDVPKSQFEDFPVHPIELAVSESRKGIHSFTKSSEQHEYLQFSLRITEDIINNDLYSNEQMREVLNGHFEANRYQLDEKKMRDCIMELCRELNVIIDDECLLKTDIECIVSKDNVCICPNEESAKKYMSGVCECLILRTPPILCAVHKEPTYSTVNKEPAVNDFTVLHEAKSEDLNKEPTTTNSADVILPYDNYDVNIKKCRCNAESCSASICYKSDETVNQLTVNTETNVIELVPSLEEVMDQSNISFQIEENNSIVVEPEVPDAVEFEVIIPQPPQPSPKTSCACLNNDMTPEYIKYFDDTTHHIKHLRELEFSHFTTTIQPPETTDFSAQTTDVKEMQCSSSQTITPPKVKNQYTTTTSFELERCISEEFKPITLPRGSKIQSDTTDDYIILNGPVYVPKSTTSRYTDNPILFNNIHHHSTPMTYNQCTMAQLDTDAAVILNKSAQVNITLHDYDMTPQKETIKQFTNTDLCSCKHKNSNLLLGNNYNMYQSANEHMSCFYPTIATQVSSMELLKYETNPVASVNSYVLQDDVDSQEALPLQKTHQPKRVSISVRSTVDDTGEDAQIISKMNSTNSSAKTSNDTLEADVFKKLDSIPELENTVSMCKRMDTMKSDMEKFREGHTDQLSRPEYNARAISISEDVKQLMDGGRTNTVTSDMAYYELRGSPKKSGTGSSRPRM